MEELFSARRRREPIWRLLWEITVDTFRRSASRSSAAADSPAMMIARHRASPS